MKYFVLLLLIGSVLAINQNCNPQSPCPINSFCQQTVGMCVCSPGFIGFCQTPAISLNSSSITANVAYNQTVLFSINPSQLNVFIEFDFNICISQPETQVYLTIWGQTGYYNDYNPFDNGTAILIGPQQYQLYSGCQQLSTPYAEFSTQPNGQNQMIILGVTGGSALPLNFTISVSQQTISGFALYYYIIIAVTIIIVLCIIIGVTVCICRRRRRGAYQMQGMSPPPPPQPVTNNIQHFQRYMPVISANLITSERSTCSICLMMIELSQSVRQTPCKHTFHASCIDSWCLKNLTCPVCRTDFSQANIQLSIQGINSNGSQYVQKVDIKIQQVQLPNGNRQILQMVQMQPPVMVQEGRQPPQVEQIRIAEPHYFHLQENHQIRQHML